MQKFEYTSVVLHLEERIFALSDKSRLKGITAESAAVLTDLGACGWELVSVVSPSSWLGSSRSMMAFLKRPIG